ncbi:MAG: hypothetical protein M3R00_10270, partial [Pseudomonadota bacterium]|nr:hypothetical protein [Pseudomonadota bacterium]
MQGKPDRTRTQSLYLPTAKEEGDSEDEYGLMSDMERAVTRLLKLTINHVSGTDPTELRIEDEISGKTISEIYNSTGTRQTQLTSPRTTSIRLGSLGKRTSLLQLGVAAIPLESRSERPASFSLKKSLSRQNSDDEEKSSVVKMKTPRASMEKSRESGNEELFDEILSSLTESEDVDEDQLADKPAMSPRKSGKFKDKMKQAASSAISSVKSIGKSKKKSIGKHNESDSEHSVD